MDVVIRKATRADEAQWKDLFITYQKFYRARLSDEVIASVWARVMDEGVSLFMVVAEGENGRLIGFAHYLFHETTWSDGQTCYLEDLFVTKAARGTGLAQKLIDAVETAARQQNAKMLYLHTQQYNSAARSLYDAVLSATPFVVYEKELRPISNK